MTEKIRIKTGDKIWNGFFHLAPLCPIFGIYPCYKIGKLRKFGALVGILIGIDLILQMVLPWPFGLIVWLPIYLGVLCYHLDKWKKLTRVLLDNAKSQILNLES